MHNKYINAGILIALLIALFAAFGVFRPNEHPAPRIDTPATSTPRNNATSTPTAEPGAEESITTSQVERVTATISEQSREESWNADVFEVPTIAGKTVYESMLTHQAAGWMTFSGREYAGLGFMLERINGKGPSGGKFWFLYVNNESAQVGASNITLKAGDRIEWRYQPSL